MKKQRKERGITLIALVVTIIVLIILATISINLVVNSNIMKKAENAKQMQARAEELERLELVKAVVAIDNAGKVTVDKYIEEAIKEGITTEGEVKDNGDGSKNITTDKGYDVNIKPDPDNPNNVIITIEGGNGEVVLKIETVRLTTNTNSIKVDVETKGAEGATYRYYYKTGEEEYKLSYEGKENSHMIKELEERTNYTIKVEVEKGKKVVYKEVEGRTEEVPDMTGKLEIGDLEWNNGTASITVRKTTEDDMKIQYKVGDGEYKEVASGGKIENLELGDVVTIRLWDGTNEGGKITVNVQDKTEPNKATIVLGKTSANTSESITATVTQSDSQSGIDITKCKWVYNKEAGGIGTEEASYTGGIFSTTPQEISLQSGTEETY